MRISIQDISSQVFFPRRAKIGMKRATFVLMLCAILTFAGSLTLTVAVSYTGDGSSARPFVRLWSNPHPKKHLRPVATRAVPAMPVPPVTPRVAPITPFPDQLWQQMAILKQYHRFLYYGNSQMPEVALTFDDGPNPDYTPQILAILQQYNIKATFFCVGRLVARYPDLVRQEYTAGNVVGNHSWTHANLGLLSSDDVSTELNLTSDTIQRTIGVRPTFFRPPYGVFNTTVLTQANAMGLTTVIWNDDARDWLRPGINVISNRILGLAGNGAIILLHDGGGDRSQTAAALPTIITSLRSSGFKFVTLQQMVNDLPKHPASDQAATPVVTTTPGPGFTLTNSATAQSILADSPLVRRRKFNL